MSVSLYDCFSPGRLCAVITGVDYSTWPDGFKLGTTGWGYVSPLCPPGQLTLIILSANGRLNLLPLIVLIICIHAPPTKNSAGTKWGYYSFLQRFFDWHLRSQKTKVTSFQTPLEVRHGWLLTRFRQGHSGKSQSSCRWWWPWLILSPSVSSSVFTKSILFFFSPCLVNDIDTMCHQRCRVYLMRDDPLLGGVWGCTPPGEMFQINSCYMAAANECCEWQQAWNQ